MKTTTIQCDACGVVISSAGLLMTKATFKLEYGHTCAQDQYVLEKDLCEGCLHKLTTGLQGALLPAVKKTAWKWSNT